MGKFIKKIVFFLPLFVLFFTNQSCQSLTKNNFEINKTARSIQAHQLLKTQYSKSVAKELEQDSKFNKYLEIYIAQENAGIDSEQLSDSLLKVSRDYLYDPVFLLAVVKTESQFNPSAVGLAGEIGLMQIKPDTAEWICLKKKIKWKGAAALKDPAYNVLVGAVYFDYLKTKLRFKSAHYINAYNLGVTSLQRLPASSRASHPYYDRVIANYNAIYDQLKKISKTI